MRPARDVSPNSSGERSARSWDRAIAGLAEVQHGVVSRAQLRELGATRHEIEHRLAVGRLHPLYRGVYAVGHCVVSGRGRWMAAVLAGGPGAVLSHRLAAALWGIRRAGEARIDVTVAAARRPRPGLRFHRTRLPVDELTVHDGIPVTTVGRTLVDLAKVLDRARLERALDQAEILRLDTGRPLDALLQRHATRPGVRRLAAAIERGGVGETVTRSELEDRFLAFLARHGLPRPQTNQIVEGYEVDCVWREQRVIVELDGAATHATAAAFERDRERDRRLHAAGWRVVRITWRQLVRDGDAVADDLRALLSRASGAGRS